MKVSGVISQIRPNIGDAFMNIYEPNPGSIAAHLCIHEVTVLLCNKKSPTVLHLMQFSSVEFWDEWWEIGGNKDIFNVAWEPEESIQIRKEYQSLKLKSLLKITE
jgi:hypothetical protein